MPCIVFICNSVRAGIIYICKLRRHPLNIASICFHSARRSLLRRPVRVRIAVVAVVAVNPTVVTSILRLQQPPALRRIISRATRSELEINRKLSRRFANAFPRKFNQAVVREIHAQRQTSRRAVRTPRRARTQLETTRGRWRGKETKTS